MSKPTATNPTYRDEVWVMSEPTGGELSRRLDQLERRVDNGFTNLDARLDTLATEKTVLAYLAAQTAEVTALRDDINDLKKADTDIRTDLRKGDQSLKDSVQKISDDMAKEIAMAREEARAAMRRAWQFGIPLAALMLGVISFVYNISRVGGAG